MWSTNDFDDTGHNFGQEAKASTGESIASTAGDASTIESQRKDSFRVVLYAHGLYLVKVNGAHEWEIISVAQIDGTLSATLTKDNSILVKWAGAERYEIACDDYVELAEHIEDAHSAHLNQHWSRPRRRTHSIAIEQNPFWSPAKSQSAVTNGSAHSLTNVWSPGTASSNGSTNSLKRNASARNNMRHNLAQLSMSAKLHSSQLK